MIGIYNIVIFGTGSLSEKLTKNLNRQVNVVCYLDNDKSKWNKKFNNKLILNPDQIKSISYDFILIASQYCNEIYSQLITLNVKKDDIFEYLYFLQELYNPFEYKVKLLEENLHSYESFITGISYFVTGITGDMLKKRGINFSFDSQDLYYDYNIAKYILENYDNKFKYAIIGLNYYSFQYDLSLSSMKDNVKLYYPRLNKKHNFKDFNYDYNKIAINRKIADKIFCIEHDKYVVSSKIIPLTEKKGDFYIIGKKQADLDCNKNYPKTVEENKIIFEKYIKLLQKYNINPIVVVCPTSKYYNINFSKRLKDQFFEIIDEMKTKYDFQYIDYFESKLFDDSMFYDVSHLTYEGGEKFTKILNETINW